MTDAELESLLFDNENKRESHHRQMPGMEYLHKELKKKGVTLQLLWYEYKQDNPDGYQYSHFCELYKKWSRKIDISLPVAQRAGGYPSYRYIHRDLV
jgi:transposase